MARSRPKKKGRGRKERNGAGGIWSLRWRQYDEKGGVYQSETINFRKSDKKTAAFRRLRKLQLVFFFCTPIASSSELLHPQMGASPYSLLPSHCTKCDSLAARHMTRCAYRMACQT